MSDVSLPADWYEKAAAETYARELSNTTNILANDHDVRDAGTRVEALFRSRNPDGVAGLMLTEIMDEFGAIQRQIQTGETPRIINDI